MNLGVKVRDLRERYGWSLTELAAQSGLSRSYIHRVEVNKHTNPSVHAVLSLAKALNTSVDYLCNGEDELTTDEEVFVRHFLNADPDIQRIMRIVFKALVTEFYT